MKLWNYICEKLIDHPHQEIREKEAVLSFEEMIVFAEHFAKYIKNEKCCAIYCQSELATAITILGCFAAGVTAVPLSPRYGAAHCCKILRLISPTCVVTDIEGDLGIYQISDSQYSKPHPRPALIMCTSGTSGSPKGVMLSEENVLTNLKDIAQYFDINDRDSILIARPLYHSAVLTGEFLLSLIKGVRIVFHSESFNPRDLLDVIYHQRITTLGGTPTLFNLLVQFSKGNEFFTLENIVLSGECLNGKIGLKIQDTFVNAKIYHVYGLTEASPRVSWLPPEHFKNNPELVGKPLNSVKIKILSKSGNPVKKGQAGILWITGKNVFIGYYNNPSLTAKSFDDGWFCTGDIAIIDENGYLRIKGRSDNMIIRAGMNIYPQEIEAELRKDNRTKEVLVYGINSDTNGTQIAMKICGEYDCIREVKELCQKILPAYQIPTHIQIVDEIEKNASGKVIRRKIHG